MDSLKEYLCKVCARPQPLTQIRHGGLCCNACSAFFQRTVFMEPSLKCKRYNICFNAPTKMTSTCRKCRFEKCLEVGMPSPKITSITAFSLTKDEAKFCAYTIDAMLTLCTSYPSLLESNFDKEILEYFKTCQEAAKKMVPSNVVPGKIEALSHLFFHNPISIDGGLYHVCYIGICKLKFDNLPTTEKEKVHGLQNDAYLKLENEKMNVHGSGITNMGNNLKLWWKQ